MNRFLQVNKHGGVFTLADMQGYAAIERDSVLKLKFIISLLGEQARWGIHVSRHAGLCSHRT